MQLARLLLALPLLAAASPAAGAASAWHETAGGAVRLVTAPEPGEDGRLRGALEIRLEPGWKTYWRDPGGTGIPPQVSPTPGSAAGAVTIGFPPPAYVDDGYSVWPGYEESVALPLTIDIVRADAPVEATIFLGICQTICIPVQARLSVERQAASDPRHAMVIDTAFARLPQPASATFGVTRTRREGDRLIVETALPDGSADAALFVAGRQGYLLGRPEAIDGRPGRFAVPVLDEPAGAPAETAGFRYTLVNGRAAVDGRLAEP